VKHRCEPDLFRKSGRRGKVFRPACGARLRPVRRCSGTEHEIASWKNTKSTPAAGVNSEALPRLRHRRRVEGLEFSPQDCCDFRPRPAGMQRDGFDERRFRAKQATHSDNGCIWRFVSSCDSEAESPRTDRSSWACLIDILRDCTRAMCLPQYA
jgi:hypothetical protein